MEIGIARLEATLRACLARVKAGRELIVTEHGRPIARLIAIVAAHDDAQAHLAEMERAGLLRRGRGGLREVLADLQPPSDPKGLVLEALIAERRS